MASSSLFFCLFSCFLPTLLHALCLLLPLFASSCTVYATLFLVIALCLKSVAWIRKGLGCKSSCSFLNSRRRALSVSLCMPSRRLPHSRLASEDFPRLGNRDLQRRKRPRQLNRPRTIPGHLYARAASIRANERYIHSKSVAEIGSYLPNCARRIVFAEDEERLTFNTPSLVTKVA